MQEIDDTTVTWRRCTTDASRCCARFAPRSVDSPPPPPPFIYPSVRSTYFARFSLVRLSRQAMYNLTAIKTRRLDRHLVWRALCSLLPMRKGGRLVHLPISTSADGRKTKREPPLTKERTCSGFFSGWSTYILLRISFFGSSLIEAILEAEFGPSLKKKTFAMIKRLQ